MDRREISITLKDGNSYLFCERNRIDSDYYALEQRLRASNLELITNTIKNEEDRLPMLIAETKRFYTPQDVMVFANSYNEKLRIAWDSFKIKNKSFLDEFEKLIDDKILNKIIESVNAIENDDIKKKIQPDKA